MELVRVLQESSNEDLEYLVNYIKEKADFTETLTGSPGYRAHHPNHSMYVDEIVHEIRLFGGNTIANKYRGCPPIILPILAPILPFLPAILAPILPFLPGEGPPYKEIVQDVANKLGVNYEYYDSVERVEMKIIKEILNRSLKGMSDKKKEEVKETNSTESGTTVRLVGLKRPTFDKKLQTIARNLVERLLPYFIAEDYRCPKIVLAESDLSEEICLNDFVSNEVSEFIQEIPVHLNQFTLKATATEEDFAVRVFKIYSPGNQKSRISLVAHKREVSGSALDKYVPEFVEEFYEKDNDGVGHERNYIIKAYTSGPYLDRTVSLERGGFEFHMENEVMLGIAQVEIEREVATIAQDAVGRDIELRQDRKKERVQTYVDDEAPWHKEILSKIDLSEMPHNPTVEDIETRLQKEKLSQELSIKGDVEKILSEKSLENVKENVVKIVNKISDTNKNDLTHYIALRRKILDLFRKSLESDESGHYSSEGVVHDIIFPRKGNTEVTPFHDHNLWIVDERLNFTKYVSSDVPLNGKNTGRPDLLVYDKRVLFRGDNEPSNPITIFEFKKPQRDDFVNRSSSEDPVQQIIRYVNNIRDGEYKTPEGRQMQVAKNTPFYGFVVCDLTSKVETWLEREKDFRPMPDRLGWFQWVGNINLYVEVISWDKILKDARMRSQIFFQKLGI